jgi:ABC-type phosphate transport system substrate-binding protein
VKIIWVVLVMVITILLSLVVYPTHADDEGATIVFSNYNIGSNIRMRRITVQRIFTLKDTRWSNGDAITVFTKPLDSIEHKIFVTQVLNMSVYRYTQSILSATNTARAVPVTEVTNDQKMLIAIQSHPGSIGYVNYELLLNGKIIHICDEDLKGCI